MPPAASGSDDPRGKSPQKATVKGPKKTPRPEGATNGSGGSSATKRGGRTSGATTAERPTGRTPSTKTATAKSTDAPPAPPTETVPSTMADPTVVTESERPVPEGSVADERRPKRPRPTRPAPPDTGRRKGRRVRRVIRRIDLWSVLKLAVVLYTCLYAAVMATLAVLWGLAYSSGQIDKVQSFMADVGMDNYRFYGDQMWRACAMIGAIGVLAATVITVLTAALVNVISEMTGGIRVVVIEEDPPPRRR